MRIARTAISDRKGTRKNCVDEAELVESGDAHAGEWRRQASLLAGESIGEARKRGFEVACGDFAENIATEGVDWSRIPVGTRLSLGKSALVEITRIGRECGRKCAVFYRAGDCIMPREGVFARVLKGGVIRRGDTIRVSSSFDTPACAPHRTEG